MMGEHIEIFEELKDALGDGVKVCQCNGCAISQDGNQPRIVDGQPHLYSEGELSIEKTGDFHVTVSCMVKNIDGMDGDEVVQLYLDDVESSVVTPLSKSTEELKEL